ncbi:MAG: tetratricopeptide repeat protein [Cardiobacteriaceae bacterium]|nr:tetratricopeptide repeat protein [Cardiobacteriaceae bacterium]
MKKLLLSLALAATAHAATLQDAKDAYLAGRHDEAVAIWRALAEQGDGKAQYNLGLALKDGNRDEARQWLEKSAAQGVAPAQLELGEMLLYGKDGLVNHASPAMQAQDSPPPEDRARGIALITQAAEQGLAEAQYRLALNHAGGIGVEKNLDQSRAWLEKAAAQLHADAQYQLGLYYLQEERQCDKALSWLTSAHLLGDWAAAGEISRLHQRGLCVEKDAAKASEWEAKALRQQEKALGKKE